MKRTTITSNLRQVYGTGNFNPKRFDRVQRPNGNKRLYLWGLGIFILAVVLAAGLGMFLFGQGGASFTGERVTLEMTGPEKPPANGITDYTLRIANSEELALEAVEAFIGFTPEGVEPGARLASSEKQPTSEAGNAWDLGTVRAGGEGTLNLSLRFSGDGGAEVRVPLRATFKPKGFSSTFTVNAEAVFTLGESALELAIEGPRSVAGGSEVALSVRIADSEELNPELRLVLEVPSGFDALSFQPARAEGEDAWRLGDLPRTGNGYELAVRGTVSGAPGESIRIVARLEEADRTVLARKEHELAITNAKAELTLAAKPAQGAKLQWGEKLDVQLTVKNASDYAMRSAVVSVALADEDLWQADSFAIGQGGFFEGGNVLWDSTTTSAFESLAPDGSVTLSFALAARENPRHGFSGTPAITAKATLRATLRDEETTAESETLTVKIFSNVELGTAGQYKSGLHPPLPGQETTYAISWTLGPSNGELKNLELKTELSSGTRWIGTTDYSVGELSHQGGRVTWRASRVPALNEPIAIQFTVGMTSSGAATNSTAIVGESTLTATDAAAEEAMEFFLPAVTVGSIQ